MVFRALFGKIKQGLAKTRSVFSGVAQLFRIKGRVDQQFHSELEKRLYLAYVGTGATAEIVDQVRQAFLDKEITGDVEAFVKQKLIQLITVDSGASTAVTERPFNPEPAATVSGLRYNPSGPT